MGGVGTVESTTCILGCCPERCMIFTFILVFNQVIGLEPEQTVLNEWKGNYWFLSLGEIEFVLLILEPGDLGSLWSNYFFQSSLCCSIKVGYAHAHALVA
jgi:hypothetical protein